MHPFYCRHDTAEKIETTLNFLKDTFRNPSTREEIDWNSLSPESPYQLKTKDLAFHMDSFALIMVARWLLGQTGVFSPQVKIKINADGLWSSLLRVRKE